MPLRDRGSMFTGLKCRAAFLFWGKPNRAAGVIDIQRIFLRQTGATNSPQRLDFDQLPTYW